MKLTEVYRVGLDNCPYDKLRVAMTEFPFDAPDDDILEEEKDSKQEEEIVYDTREVQGMKIVLCNHQLQSMEFTYWGTIRCFDNDPHGVGVAIATLNRQHCYMGLWHKGQLKGYGQRWIDTAVGSSCYFGKFIGIGQSNERRGPQWDVDYRVMGQDKVIVSRFIDRNPTVTGNKNATEHIFQYRRRDQESELINVTTCLKANTASVVNSVRDDNRFKVKAHKSMMRTEQRANGQPQMFQVLSEEGTPTVEHQTALDMEVVQQFGGQINQGVVNYAAVVSFSRRDPAVAPQYGYELVGGNLLRFPRH